MEVLHKLDGIVVILKDWEHFLADAPLVVNADLNIEKVASTDFRGARLETVEGQEVVKTCIGIQGGFRVTVISIQSKGSGALSDTIWSSKWLIPNAEITREVMCRRGQSLFQRIKNHYGNRGGSTRVIYSNLGNSEDWALLDQKLNSFERHDAGVEIFVHYARDYARKYFSTFFDSKLVMKAFREKVEINGRATSIVKETYPAALQRGLANFYIQPNRKLGTISAKICVVKLYSEVFKTCHNRKLFPRERIAKMMLCPIEFEHGFSEAAINVLKEARLAELVQVQQDIQSIRDEILSFGGYQNTHYGRCEIILKIVGQFPELPLGTATVNCNNDNLGENAAEKITNAIEKDAQLSSKKIIGLTKLIRTRRLGENLKRDAFPFLNTLRMFVNSKIQSFENNSHWNFEPRKLLYF